MGYNNPDNKEEEGAAGRSMEQLEVDRPTGRVEPSGIC